MKQGGLFQLLGYGPVLADSLLAGGVGDDYGDGGGDVNGDGDGGAGSGGADWDAAGDSSLSIPETLGSAKNRSMFFGDQVGDDGGRVKAPKASSQQSQRDS